MLCVEITKIMTLNYQFKRSATFLCNASPKLCLVVLSNTFLIKSLNKHGQIISKCVKDRFCLWPLTVKVKEQVNVKDQLHRKG